jgi:RNA polymerase sigma factor (sigma-70 family)
VFFRKRNIKVTYTDKELILKFKETGDSYYAGELFQRYSHLVFGVSMKYLKNQDESRDAVMQIFEKLLTDLKKHEIDNFKSWIHVVTKNFCLMKLRTEKRLEISYEETETEVMEMNYTLHHIEESIPDEAFQKLDQCIEKLIDEQRKCVQLFYIEEKCYKEIVDATGYDLKKVKSYIQNGKRNLKICMEGKHVMQGLAE